MKFLPWLKNQITNQICICCTCTLLVTGIQLSFTFPENRLKIWLVIFFYQGRNFMLSKFVCLAALWNWALPWTLVHNLWPCTLLHDLMVLEKSDVPPVCVFISRDEIVQTFVWIQTFYVGLVKKIRQYFCPQIKKSCSLAFFSSALDTVSKSSLESITLGVTKW